MQRLINVIEKFIYLTIALFGMHMASLLIFLLIPTKMELSAIEGMRISKIFEKLGDPQYSLEVKGIFAWQINHKIIRKNIEIRTSGLEVDLNAFPRSIKIANTLGDHTQYFKISKFSRFDEINGGFVRKTIITVWPYGDFLINKEIIEAKDQKPS